MVCSDHSCAKSTNNSAFTVFLSTAGGTCIPKRWSFAQITGALYGANDCHDPIMQYDGTNQTNFTSQAPLGSILETTKDRLVVSGVAASPNNVYYSQAGNYSNFTNGINSADPYVDPIGSSGDQVRALKYALGRLFIFKTNSITACILGDQYSSRCFPVSNSIGTSDPQSVVEVPGALLFRGSDRNYWSYDTNNGLGLISKKISNLVATQTSGSTQNNTQTSQTDWQAGNQTPATAWNTSTISGSIFPSSVTFVDATSLAFGSGTFTAALSTATGADLRYASPQTLIYNGNFGTGDLTYWTCNDSHSGGFYSNTCSVIACPSGYCLNLNTGYIGGGQVQQRHAYVNIYDGTASVYQYDYGNFNTSNGSINLASLGISTRTLSIKFTETENDSGSGSSNLSVQSATFTAVSSIYWYSSGNTNGQNFNLTLSSVAVDRYFAITQSSAVSSFFSQVFNTSQSTNIGGPFLVAFSSNPGTAITFQVHSSSSPNNDLWTSWASISSGTRVTQTKQYVQYQSSFTTLVGTMTPTLSYVGLSFATTGQFVTQCIQPGTQITSWGQLNCSQSIAGNGSEVFYATSAPSCAALPTSTQPPVNVSGLVQLGWTAQTNNSNLSISTNSAVIIGFRSLLGSATDQAQVDACTLYWTNGTASPPSWGTYDPIKNAAYWSTAINNSATSNRVLKYDLNLNEWYPFSLNAQVIYRNPTGIYFGDSTGGYWNQFGTGNSDNGAAINAYWISRDFGNQSNPFVDNSYRRLSLVAKNQTTGSMTVGYTFSTGQTGSYSVSLATSAAQVYVHSNQNLLKASPYQFMNINLGNNSTTPFEVDALMLELESFGWRPQNP